MTDTLTLGWEEWFGLPELGLPAIKAKIDTGTEFSVLHAAVIEPFGPTNNPQVRFLVRPDPDNPRLEVTCSAKVLGRRDVRDGNGDIEARYVIGTRAQMGTHSWPIELTLSNRKDMAWRMMLGRSAITSNMIIAPGRAFVQPVSDYKVYKTLPRKRAVKRPLRIALLTRGPGNYSSRRIGEASEARGHIIDKINTSRCYMRIDSKRSEVHYDGKVLPRYDAVIPRIGASITAYGTAVLRQFASTGAYCLNSASAITFSRDKLLAHQLLARAGIDMPVTAFASSPKDTHDIIDIAGSAPIVVKLTESSQGQGVILAETRQAAESLVDAFRGLHANFLVQEFIAEAAGADTRCFVIGNKVVGAMRRQAAPGDFRSNLHRGGTAQAVKLTVEERDIARKAAKELGLSVAGVDILTSDTGPKVLEVNSSPGLEGIETATGKDIATKMITYLETRVRTLGPMRTRKEKPQA